MSDLISRSGLLNKWNALSERGRTEFDQVIMTQPTIEAVPVVHGEWKFCDISTSYLEPPSGDTCECSVCGFIIDVSETNYNFCPNCGADMRKGGAK